MAEEKRSIESLTDEELEAEWRRMDRRRRDEASAKAWETHSTFANQFHVNVDHDVTRITFGEATSPGGVPVSWRTSVTLTTAQALQLADFIWAQYDKEAARQRAHDEAEANKENRTAEDG